MALDQWIINFYIITLYQLLGCWNKRWAGRHWCIQDGTFVHLQRVQECGVDKWHCSACSLHRYIIFWNGNIENWWSLWNRGEFIRFGKEVDSGKSDIVKTDNLRTYALCRELPRGGILCNVSTEYLSTHFQCDPVMHAIGYHYQYHSPWPLPLLIVSACWRAKTNGFLSNIFT